MPSEEQIERDEVATVLRFPSNPRHRDADGATALRTVIGDVLRDERHAQERTLADVAATAAVSIAYLSEVERGRKEISSDLLDAVGGALDLTLVDVLQRCVERLRPERGSGVQLRAA